MQINKSIRTVEQIGSIVSPEYFFNLTNAFREKYPNEVSSITISRSLIENILTIVPGVAGIKFISGMANRTDPLSRQIILAPCTGETGQGEIPHSIFLHEGFWLHTGERISLTRVWKSMSESVEQFLQIEPTITRKQALRSVFVGKDSLRELMMPDACKFIRFHYGYTKSHTRLLEPCFEAINGQQQSMEVYLDFTAPCPTECDTAEECIVTAATTFAGGATTDTILTSLRTYRDHWLIKNNESSLFEMYYDVSPSLNWKIRNHGNSDVIYQDILNRHITPSIQAIKEERFADTKEIMRQSVDELLNEHLLVNG